MDVQVDAVLKAPALSEQQLEGSSSKTWLHHDDKVCMSIWKRIWILMREVQAPAYSFRITVAQRLVPLCFLVYVRQ